VGFIPRRPPPTARSWGYAEQLADDPHALPAAVDSANPTDCAAEENTIAGLGRCFGAMAQPRRWPS